MDSPPNKGMVEILSGKQFSEMVGHLSNDDINHYFIIKGIKSLEWGLKGEESLDNLINTFTFVLGRRMSDKDVISLKLGSLSQRTSEEKKAFFEQVNQAFQETAPRQYYRGMIKCYQDLFDTNLELQEVRSIVEENLPGLLEYPDSRRFSVLLRSLNPDKREKIRQYVSKESKLDEAFVSSLKEKIIELDQVKRYEFHREILAYAKKHFGMDETAVHVDIVSYSNILDDVLTNELSNSFNQIVRTGERDVKYRILRNSGKGKLAVLIGVLGLYVPDHQGEYTWRISSGEEGYSDLKVHGPPWGAVLENTLRLLEEYQKDPEATRRIDPMNVYRAVSKSTYSSVCDDHNEEQDAVVMNEITSKFSEYISFSGFVPYLYSHDRTFFHRVIEIDYAKISKDQRDPPGFLEKILDLTREKMMPNKAVN